MSVSEGVVDNGEIPAGGLTALSAHLRTQCRRAIIVVTFLEPTFVIGLVMLFPKCAVHHVCCLQRYPSPKSEFGHQIWNSLMEEHGGSSHLYLFQWGFHQWPRNMCFLTKLWHSWCNKCADITLTVNENCLKISFMIAADNTHGTSPQVYMFGQLQSSEHVSLHDACMHAKTIMPLQVAGGKRWECGCSATNKTGTHMSATILTSFFLCSFVLDLMSTG